MDTIKYILGIIACNCQERTPYAPIRAYIDYLKKLGYSDTLEVLAQIQTLGVYEQAMKDSKSQGLFLTHASLNHSCDPNAEIINSSESNIRISLLS